MLEFIVTQFSALIKPLQELSKDKRDLRDNALRAISHALTETYLYYRDLDKGKPKSPDIERQLANYWAAAAIPLRHIDQDLAMTCEFKAEYWVNSDNWTEDQIHEHGIALDGLKQTYRKLLSPSFSRARLRIEPKL